MTHVDNLFLDSQANNYSSFSQSLSFMRTPISGGPSFESLLMRMDDIRSQSGRSNVSTRFCTTMGEETIRQLLHADSISVTMSYASDLECVGQTTAGVAGVTHSVQGFTGEPCGALHQAVGSHVGHIGGHQEGGDTLGTGVVGHNTHHNYKGTENLNKSTTRTVNHVIQCSRMQSSCSFAASHVQNSESKG